MKLKEAAAEYMEEKRRTRRANTVEGYESALRCHVLPRWGDVDVEDIECEDVQAWVLSFDKPGAAKKAFKTLRQVLRWTIRRHKLRIWLATDGVELPRMPFYRPRTLDAREIGDLQRFLNALGGRVSGAGTGRVLVRGVSSLGGASFRPMPDRIVAGTLLIAGAITGGQVAVEGARPADLGAVLDKLRQAGCGLEEEEDRVTLAAPARLRPVEVSTQPFPGFPTDMQAQIMAMCCVAQGASLIVENVFENRFAHAAQLRCMGADIWVSGRMCLVRGGKLTGAKVAARDLRGGAALVLAGLAAEGVTEVEGAGLIDRGYEGLERMLGGLGARVERI